MSDFVLPSSPSWFLSAISCGSEAGLYAFGSRDDVLVYDLSPISSKEKKKVGQSSVSSCQSPKLVAFFSEHSNKVLAVNLSPDPTQWICCSCQEDLIKLWDVRSLVTIQETTLTETKAKLTCLSWSAADTDFVYASTDKGTVLLWQLKSNSLLSHDFSREPIVCIAASPHQSNVAAVGYRTGIATLVSFENGRALILHRLRSQEAEIYSISWCPLKGEDLTQMEHPSQECGALLAVAGRHSVRVWSSLRGNEVFHVKLNPASVSRRDVSDSFAKKNWAAVVWSKQFPRHIVFSESQGDLFYINIRNENEQDVERFSISGINKHTRMIFNVVEAGGKLCSFSLDRTLAIWDNKTKSGLLSWTSFAGNVFCARVSPLDPGRIAIGAGDNNIRIWNQNNKSNCGDITHLYNGIRSKVTHVAWHPEKEGLLAYGTEDGSVGVCNTLVSKVPEISKTFHNKTVYVVCWAPALKAEKGSSDLQVYSVGDGTVLQHFFDQSGRDAVNLIEAINGSKEKPNKNLTISELSWRHDYTVFALGRLDGCVAVYSFPGLELLCSVQIQTKLVNCVRWHPPSTSQSPGLSPCSNLMAFAGNDSFISIVDFKSQSVDFSVGAKSAHEPLCITEGQGHLGIGKSNRITDLCWSPHQDGLLASAGYNGVAIVWDARSMSQLACYKHDMGRLLTVIWSHLDSDTVMSGGTDNTFRKWKVSEQPNDVKQKKKKKRVFAKSKAIEEGTLSEDTASTSEIKELEELLKLKERQLLTQMKVANDPSSAQTEAPDERGPGVGQATTLPGSSSSSSGEKIRLDSTKTLAPPSKSRQVQATEATACGNSATTRITSWPASGQHGDQSDDGEGSDDGQRGEHVIPTVKELVLPVKRLFPDRPAESGASRGLDGRGAKVNKLKLKPRGLFPVSAAANNRSRSQLHEDILDLTRVVAGQDPTDIIDEKPHLGLYTDKLGAHRCLLQESARHVGDGKMDYHLHLEMWRGNVAGAVQLAQQRNELSDWIVAMAPMASRETWEKVCGAYAEQLEEDGQYYKAASYLLAGHRVVDAIELFQRHGLYREAVSLAKVRLSPIDPMLEGLYLEWGTQLMKDGQFEQSAKCYLAMKQVQEAGRMVARRHDLASLKTACHMNLLVQEQEQALAYAHKALSQFLLAGQWREGHAFLKEHEGLKIFQPVVIAHELLVQQLSLMCPDLALTQKPVNSDSASSAQDPDGTSSRQTLPEFILGKSDMDPVVPWEPLVLCGDGVARTDDGAGEGHGPLHTFPHHLMRVWHKRLNVAMMTTDLKATRVAIDRLTKIRSSMMDLPNILVMVSIDVTSCLLALLASETSSAINHLLQAMAVIQGSSSVNDQYKLLLPALCRLMLSQGPKYLLKLQQEFKALRVLLTMESDGDMDHAGGEGNNSIKRFLTDIKEEEAISTSSNWCRELDCLRAYYYLAVLDFLHETQRAGEVAGSPGGGSVSGGSAQENDSLDGEPTSEGSSSGAPSAGRSVTLSPGSNVEDKKAQSEDSEDVGPSPSQDCDQSGKEGVETPGADKSKSVPAANFVCDQDCDDSSKKPEKGNANLKSPSKSSESKSSIAGVPATVPQLDATSSLSSLDSSVDPPPLPVSPGAAHTKDHQKLASPGTGPHPPPAASLSPTGQKSPKKSTEAFSPKSTSPHHLSLSPHNQSSHQMSPSHHITSIASSPQTPASRSSTASTPAKDRRAELNKEKLLRLSRGLLWDSQAKSECLTETLGYIHKAISQHLLANRAPTTPTSGSPMAAPASASTAASPGGEQLSSDAASSTSPAKSPGSAHQAGGKSNSPQAQSSCVESSAKTSPAPLSASTPPGVVHNPGDSLEEDGSVQQRRMTNLSNSPQQQGAGNSSPGTSTKDTSPSQATLLQQQSPSDPKTSPPSSSKPSQLPRSVSAGTSPVSQSSVLTAATVTQSPRAAARSLSESSSGSAAFGFDRSIGIQAERDLLGELAGEPISFSNSKKVLWLDNSTKPNWPANEPVPLRLSPNGRNLRTAPAAWAESRREALLAPDGSSLPVEWDDLPVDVKFNKSYVTMALLKHHQEAIMQELKKGPDISKVPFPSKSCSVRRLLECCLDSYHLSHKEKKVYIKQLSDWAMLFSVTTHQKSETEALFKNIPEAFQD